MELQKYKTEEEKQEFFLHSNANNIECLETGLETDLITTSQSGAHTHTIDMSTTQLSYYGEGKPIEFEPLYYSLIYIMKIS